MQNQLFYVAVTSMQHIFTLDKFCDKRTKKQKAMTSEAVRASYNIIDG